MLLFQCCSSKVISELEVSNSIIHSCYSDFINPQQSIVIHGNGKPVLYVPFAWENGTFPTVSEKDDDGNIGKTYTVNRPILLNKYADFTLTDTCDLTNIFSHHAYVFSEKLGCNRYWVTNDYHYQFYMSDDRNDTHKLKAGDRICIAFATHFENIYYHVNMSLDASTTLSEVDSDLYNVPMNIHTSQNLSHGLNTFFILDVHDSRSSDKRYITLWVDPPEKNHLPTNSFAGFVKFTSSSSENENSWYLIVLIAVLVVIIIVSIFCISRYLIKKKTGRYIQMDASKAPTKGIETNQAPPEEAPSEEIPPV